MEHIKLILLQRVQKLGSIGDIVKVKPGFARNYLLPKKIALRADKENIKYFEDKRAQIEAHNAETRAEAQKIADKVKRFSVTLVRQASEKGHLYGSVTSRDIAAKIKTDGVAILPSQVNLPALIKELGTHDLTIDLHPEVSVPLRLSIAKTEEEARHQLAEIQKKEAKEAKANKVANADCAVAVDAAEAQTTAVT